jgi:hypothetical protein
MIQPIQPWSGTPYKSDKEKLYATVQLHGVVTTLNVYAALKFFYDNVLL